MKRNSRPKKPLAGQSPDGHDRVPVKVRDGSTVHAVAPSRKAIGASNLNGDTPYFRFYADSWRARLAGFSCEAQALVLQAAAIGWSESLCKPLKLSKVRWAQACGFPLTRLDAALTDLAGFEWIEIAVEGEAVSIAIPDLFTQAGIVTYERDKKRAYRAKTKVEGQSPGRIDRGSDVREMERPERLAVKPEKAIDPAEVERGKALIRETLKKIGKPVPTPRASA